MQIAGQMEATERYKSKYSSSDVHVRTKDPMQQKNPAKKALKGKDPTRKAYANCMSAVASAQTQNKSRTCIGKESKQSFGKPTCLPCYRKLHK